MTIRYITLSIGRVPRPIVGTRLARERIKAERAAHDQLGQAFGDGDRRLLVFDVRKKYCTVLDPWTLRYIADFEHRWIEDAPDVAGMKRSTWSRIAQAIDDLRRLLDRAAKRELDRTGRGSAKAHRPKHDRTIKAAAAACRALGIRRNGKDLAA